MNGWGALLVKCKHCERLERALKLALSQAGKTFSCGHTKNKANTKIHWIKGYAQPRCRQCHNERSRQWMKEHYRPTAQC